jgi:hypothetical protein
MLLCQACEVPQHEDLREVPEWLLPDYARFLCVMPRVFLQRGDADRYCVAMSASVAALERYARHEPPLPLAARLRDIFVTETSLLQVYFNERNLRELYRSRARLVESWAMAQDAPLAHTFADCASASSATISVRRPRRISCLRISSDSLASTAPSSSTP